MPTNEEILKMTTSAVVVGRVVVGEGGVERFIEINGEEEREMGVQEDVRTGAGMQRWRREQRGMGVGTKMETASEMHTSNLNHGSSNSMPMSMAWPSMNAAGTR
jgi:hypothetical protein